MENLFSQFARSKRRAKRNIEEAILKPIPTLILATLVLGCSETTTSGGSSNTTKSSATSNADSTNSSKPYMSELLRKYSVTGSANEPYGLWKIEQSYTSSDGAVTLTVYWRITKDSVSVVAACVSNKTKKYSFAPTMATVLLTKESDGSYSFSIPKPIENVIETNGMTCRSSIDDGRVLIKLDERGMLLVKNAGDVQFSELSRVK
jgi:hypothetical protein